MKVYISPDYKSPDNADGGIRRVVEAQKRHLPDYGIEVVEDIEQADLAAVHAGAAVKVPPRMPMVAHCHGLYWAEYEWQRWHSILNRQVIDVMLDADVVTAPSHWVAQALRRNFAFSPTVLWHGVDLDDWPDVVSEGGRAHDAYVLWNKARVDAVCDPAPVVELAKRAVTLPFVTTFAPRGAPSNVRTVPPQSYDDARRLIQRAGVYLCTTRETFGIGTLEAMASGVPILGWDFGGQAEIVAHLETGYLAPVGDYERLAEGLAYCVTNRERLGRAAREAVVAKFQWSNVMAEYASLYRDLAGSVDSVPTPRTSIIVTNYNLSRYLPECIDSIVAQTDNDWEVVLIDDASTEPGERLAAETQSKRDRRIRFIQHDFNQYLAESLNDGLDHARGRYILPLDADNLIAPDTLTILGDRLDGDRSVDIAYGAVEFFKGERGEGVEGNFVSQWPPDEFDFRAQLTHRNQIPSTAMYRKRVAERVGGYRPRCKTAEDADFWCRATSYGARPVKATTAVTLIYRDREDSMSRSNEDWPWESWYPWGKRWELTPPGAPVLAAPGSAPDPPRVLHAADPRVTVVIPVGPGHERKVLEALDSLQAQTFTNWKCVVVDATGGTLGWTHPWAVRVGSSDMVMGPAEARNYGMEFAAGDYYLFLDADDYLEPGALDQFMLEARLIQADEFLYSDWIIDEEHRIVEAKEYDCEGLLRQLEYPVTALYPMPSWRASKGFDEAFDVAWEDWDFALRIARAGYCGRRVAKPLLHYRMSAGTRREAGFARREELKKLVYSKWQPFIEGQEKLMACGSCGKRSSGGSSVPAGARQARAAVPMGPTTADAVLVEYIGPHVGPLIFNGKSTGTRYRFGQDPDHRLRYVRAADVPGLLAMVASFQLAVEGASSTPELVASA